MRLKLAEYLEDFLYFISTQWRSLKSFINSFFCAHGYKTFYDFGDDNKKYGYPACVKCYKKIKVKRRLEEEDA